MTNSDLSVIESDRIRDTLREIVENRLKSKKYKINISSASQAGANNFIGIVHRVSFCKDDEDENGENVSKLILKVAPQSAARRNSNVFSVRPPFLQEIYVYDTVNIDIESCSFFKPEFKLPIYHSFDFRFYHISVNLSNRKV